MGEQSLHRLVRDGLVEDFDYNIKCGVGFCESCIKEDIIRVVLKVAKHIQVSYWS